MCASVADPRSCTTNPPQWPAGPPPTELQVIRLDRLSQESIHEFIVLLARERFEVELQLEAVDGEFGEVAFLAEAFSHGLLDCSVSQDGPVARGT